MAATYTGQCQICQNYYKVTGIVLARHGYRRPRWGHEVGHCLGGQCVPWEASCERAKWYLERLGTFLLSDRALLVQYETGEVSTLYRKSLRTGQPVLVTKEDPTWALTLGEAIRALKSQIYNLERAIKEMGERIAAWKPGALREIHGIAV